MCYPTYRPGQEIIVLRGHEDCVASAAFSPDGARIVTASDDRTARIWDTVTAHEIALLRGHKDRMTRAAFSADGARIVTASDDLSARIWDAAERSSPCTGTRTAWQARCLFPRRRRHRHCL